MKKVYLSGPIASDPDARQHFNEAEEEIIEASNGWEVVNPFDVPPVDHGDNPCPEVGYFPGTADASQHTSSCCYMRTDIAALLDCDAIYLLPGWRRSKGAAVELAVATACGMEVYICDPRDEDAS